MVSNLDPQDFDGHAPLKFSIDINIKKIDECLDSENDYRSVNVLYLNNVSDLCILKNRIFYFKATQYNFLRTILLEQ